MRVFLGFCKLESDRHGFVESQPRRRISLFGLRVWSRVSTYYSLFLDCLNTVTLQNRVLMNSI